MYACVCSPRLLGRQRSATLRRAEVHSRVPACLCSFAQVNVTREAAFCHIIASGRGPFESPSILVFIHPGHSGAAFSNITTGLDPLESLCMLVFILPTDILRRALGLLESLCIVVFILVRGFAALLDPLWKALLQALHSREIFSCTTDNRKRKKNIPF